MPPPDQTAATRPISFLYQNTYDNSGSGFKEMTLIVRPEELTRTETSRLTVHQTLGGAYADSFGGGIPTVQIAGHTGWGSANARLNGIEHMTELYKAIYAQWHIERQRTSALGLDPNEIKLIFSDLLDGFTWVVAPQSFVLKRNKSNPLLAYYQISLTWLANDVASPLGKVLSKKGGMMADAVASLTASINRIQAFAGDLIKGINDFFSPIHSAVGELVQLANTVNKSVLSVINAGYSVVNTVAGNLMGIASGLTQAAHSVLDAVAAVTAIPETLKATVMLVKSAFLNIACLFHNAFNGDKTLSFYDIYGSSLCSSTQLEGRPLSSHLNQNTFEAVLPVEHKTLAINHDAMTGIHQLKQLDTLKLPRTDIDYVSSTAAKIVKNSQLTPMVRG